MGQSCPPKLKRVKSPPEIYYFFKHIFEPKQDKAQVTVHKEIVEKHKHDPEGESSATDDTTRRKKNLVKKGHSNRMIDLQDSTLVFNRKITLTIYDYAYVDGDNITLFQDGKQIIRTYVKSPKTPTILKVRISKRRPSIIEMLANNLGYIPPNTAMIEVNDGNIIKKIVLYSDIKESGTFKVTYSKTKIKKKPEKVEYPKFKSNT